MVPLALMLPEPVATAEPGGNLKLLPGSPALGTGGSSWQVTCRDLPRFAVILFSKSHSSCLSPPTTKARAGSRVSCTGTGRREEGTPAARRRILQFSTAARDGVPTAWLKAVTPITASQQCPGTNHPRQAPATRTPPVPPRDAGREGAGLPAAAARRLRSGRSLCADPHPGVQDPSDGAGPATSPAPASASPASPGVFWEVCEGRGLQRRCCVKWDLQRWSFPV